MKSLFPKAQIHLSEFWEKQQKLTSFQNEIIFKFLLLYMLGIAPLAKMTPLMEIRILLFIFLCRGLFHSEVDLGPFGIFFFWIHNVSTYKIILCLNVFFLIVRNRSYIHIYSYFNGQTI